jgi:hypothetical protein
MLVDSDSLSIMVMVVGTAAALYVSDGSHGASDTRQGGSDSRASVQKGSKAWRRTGDGACEGADQQRDSEWRSRSAAEACAGSRCRRADRQPGSDSGRGHGVPVKECERVDYGQRIPAGHGVPHIRRRSLRGLSTDSLGWASDETDGNERQCFWHPSAPP